MFRPDSFMEVVFYNTLLSFLVVRYFFFFFVMFNMRCFRVYHSLFVDFYLSLHFGFILSLILTLFSLLWSLLFVLNIKTLIFFRTLLTLFVCLYFFLPFFCILSNVIIFFSYLLIVAFCCIMYYSTLSLQSRLDYFLTHFYSFSWFLAEFYDINKLPPQLCNKIFLLHTLAFVRVFCMEFFDISLCS